MAFIRNPTIIRDGLVFAFDLWDKDTCYKGRPTTNSIAKNCKKFISTRRV